ncbi:hypothetical protein H696_06268 [Fonticula alba]|uniref:EGF-like domain-containing protein n=1 Tax=Fonticula alba TaxID=691883 RepID=A0A058Z038_FONAL|nr:hypothetical protein H696_06268 [Fonticula alba]KCV67308.1 hypothetical protein H696_06268 [Fonticula alba]|eukprot:XP_009498286.1 hypothetical protein H696_06268 [Fonticula alba]
MADRGGGGGGGGGGRPRTPSLPTPMMMLMMMMLVILLRLPRAAPAEELYRSPLAVGPAILAFGGDMSPSGGGPSIRWAASANLQASLYNQKSLRLDVLSDTRFGGALAPEPALTIGPERNGASAGSHRALAFPTTAGLGYIQHTDNKVAIYLNGDKLLGDVPLPHDILAAYQQSQFTVDLLVLDRHSQAFILYTASLGYLVSMDGPPDVQGVQPGVRAVVGSRNNIYTFTGMDVLVLFKLSGAVKSTSHAVDAPVTDIVALCPNPATGQDIVVALAGQELYFLQVDINRLLTRVHAFTPAAGPATDRRLVAPEIHQGPSPSVWLLLLDRHARQVWRVTYSAQGITETELRFPGATLPTAGFLDELHLIRLSRPAGQPTPWQVASSRHVYSLAGEFGCSTDETIVCQHGLAPPDTGFACADGRALTPFALDGYMCGGCAAGFEAIAQPGGPPDCRRCQQAGCLTCYGGQCAACQAPRLLQVDPRSGATSCVTECGPGFTADQSRCWPRDSTAGGVALLATHTWRLASQRQLVFRFFARSRLSVKQGLLFLALTPEPTSLLGFLAPGAWSSAVATVLQPDQPAMAAASGSTADRLLVDTDIAFGSFLQGRVDSYAEIGPVRGQSQVGYVGFFCGDGLLRSVDYTCGSANTSGCLIIPSTATQLSSCESMRLLREEPPLVSVRTAGPGPLVSLYFLGDDERLGSALLHGATEHPSLFPPVGPGEPWLWRTAGPMAVLLPLALGLAGDSRAAAGDLPGALAAPLPDPSAGASHLEPVFLPGAGPDAAPREDFLLSWLDLGSSPGAWRIRHVPRGAGPRGSTSGLASHDQVLGVLPAAPGARARTLAVRLSGPGVHPVALVLLTEAHVGVSLLRCPSEATGGGFCWPGPARFHPLPEPLAAAEHLTAVLLDAPADGAASLLLGPAGGQVLTLSIRPEDCPEGTFGPGCLACAEVCATCSGPSELECIRCKAHLAGAEARCLSACPGDMAADPASGQCPCPVGCLSCTAPAPGPADGYHCTACHPGWVLTSAPEAGCQACALACAECSVPADPLACTACPPGHVLHRGSCPDECPTGFWADADSGLCVACRDGCQACSPGGVCTACLVGHHLEAGGCRPCDASCDRCTEAGACTTCRSNLVFLATESSTPSLCGSTCAPGEYVGAGRCAACDGSCALCAQAADRCLVCAAGFRWSGGPPAAGATGTCVPCDPGCASCRADGCLVCEADLVLGPNGQCIADCPAGMFSNGESCQPCDVSCRACAGGGADQCTGCGAGLELVEAAPGVGACVSGCPAGQYRAGADCLPCDGACATCNGPTDKDCWRCAGAVLQGDDCVQTCAAGHVAIGGRCLACHASCSECAGVRSTECTGCPGDLYPLPAEQWPSRCAGACPVGYHTSACGCRQCAAHCSSCPGSPDTCALCERGWLLAGPACVAQCPAGTSPQGGLCASCHGSCGSCYGPGPEHCLTCGEDSPLLVDGHCHATCPEGTFRSDQDCQPCSPTCGTCSGPGATECTACPADRVLQDGSCLLSCSTGHFAEADRTCRACHGSCLACAGAAADQCTACPGQTYLDRGLCAGVCPAGTFGCGVTRSAAIMLWECLHRGTPWDGLNFEEIAQAVAAGTRPDVQPAAVQGADDAQHHALVDLLQAAWGGDPAARPLAVSLRQKVAMLALSAPGGWRL